MSTTVKQWVDEYCRDAYAHGVNPLPSLRAMFPEWDWVGEKERGPGSAMIVVTAEHFEMGHKWRRRYACAARNSPR
jgi:hypothetical protein